MTDELAALRVRDLTGVFAARRLGRELAGGLGLDRHDQVRVATALSEVCRSAVTVGQSAVIAFGADPASLVVTVTVSGDPPAEGLAAAARLMDGATTAGPVIRMTKRRPQPSAIDLDAVREALTAMLPESALGELRRDNEDLIATLEDGRRQQEQLELLSAGLRETNRGVMALYSEPSEELEQTNRGVVALYRELDNATATLLTLVNDLLDVAKAESGQLVLDPVEVSLPLLLATLRGLTRPMAEGKPVDVTVSTAGAPTAILTDEAALTAILRNLLSNAIKYIDQGEVRLTVRSAPSKPGAGTTAVLSLPDGLPSAGTVVVAVGDPAMRAVVTAMLDGIADRVVAAADGAQALAAVAGGGIDLVLADPGMPGVDGCEVLAQLPAGLPAVIVTGLDVATPPRAAALIRKDQLTRERLAFAVRRALSQENR